MPNERSIPVMPEEMADYPGENFKPPKEGCLQTDRISGPCAKCGEPVGRAHLDERQLSAIVRELGGGLVTMPIYCAACCPHCAAQVSIDWEHAPAPTLQGKQEGLF